MQEIQQRLKKVIQSLYGLDFEPEITPAPANIDADYSTNTPLKLAKELHKSPMEIAAELNQKLNASISAPGFLNFTLSDEYLNTEITKLSKNFTDYISSDTYKNQTIICEFSDPNPFKVLHVGHLYTSVVGDAISRLYESAGAKVIRANSGGDVGLHVAKTMYVLQQKDPSTLTIEDIAKCYVEGTAAYEDDETAHEEITKLNKEIYKINADQIHGTKTSELYWRGRELSYDYFKDFYAKIDLKFDKFYPESTVAALGLKTVNVRAPDGVC